MATAFKGYCPRCQQELVAGEFQSVELDMCAGCYGIVLEQNRLSGLLDVMANDLKDSLDLDAALEAVPNQGGEIACPRCHAQMEHYGYLGSNWVMIDSCKTCHVLWLDTDELGMMSLLYARSQMRSEQIHKDRYVPPSLAPRIRANRLGGVVQQALMGGFGF